MIIINSIPPRRRRIEMQFKRIARIISLVLFFTIHPTAVKEEIISSKPDQLIYLLGQYHHNPTVESKEQLTTLMKILESAEKKEEPEFHFLVEHLDTHYDPEYGSYAGDMNICLIPEARKKGFHKSVFEDIEMRHFSTKCELMLEDPDVALRLIGRYKQGKIAPPSTEIVTEESLREGLHELFPTSINANEEAKHRFFQGILEQYKKEPKKNEPDVMDDVRWTRLENEITYKNAGEICTIDKMTFKDLVSNLEQKVTDLESYVAGLPESEKPAFSYRMQGAWGTGGLKMEMRYFKNNLLKRAVSYDDTILAFSKARKEAEKKWIGNYLSAIDCTIMDLNLYRRIRELQRTSVKKIVVIAGDSHANALASHLKDIGFDKYKVFVDEDETIEHPFLQNKPLRIEYLELLEPPVSEMQDTLFVSSTCVLL